MAASNIKIAYPSTSSLTITLASLASDASLLAGEQSDAVSNTSNLYLDYLVAGKITTGTSPTTGKQIEVWAYAQESDGGGTPVYPDAITGSNGGATFTSLDIKYASMALIALLNTDSNSNRTYWFKPTSIRSAFGGVVPPKWGIFVVHNTGVALNATGSNQAIYAQPSYLTVG